MFLIKLINYIYQCALVRYAIAIPTGFIYGMDSS
jgi:hypothetical protein